MKRAQLITDTVNNEDINLPDDISMTRNYDQKAIFNIFRDIFIFICYNSGSFLADSFHSLCCSGSEGNFTKT